VLFNDETFSVVFQGKSCELRNTKEYAFIKRISKRPGAYVSLDELRASVWQDEHVEKNTVQRVVSNLRRQLESVGLVNLEIDGKTNRHHYALKIKA
jgi:DNA-binding response OmpR family regulator